MMNTSAREEYIDYLIREDCGRPKGVKLEKVSKIKLLIYRHEQLWHEVFTKRNIDELPPDDFYSANSQQAVRSRRAFWEWVETLIRENTKVRQPKVTVSNLISLAARLWDVSISEKDADQLWRECCLLIKKERQKFYNQEKSYLKYCQEKGSEPEPETFDPDGIIQIFLTDILGQPCRFDENDRFIESAYVKKFGKQFLFENIERGGKNAQ